MIRRLLGLLTMFVMFHLSLVGTDAACAAHGVHGAEMAMAASTLDASVGHAMEHGASKAPCETPSSAHCCDAVTSCGVTAVIAPPDRGAAEIPLVESPSPSSVTRLISRALTPEPPPPKL